LEDYQSAVESLSVEHYRIANNRAYYCIFHAIRAVLALDGKDFKKHSSVIGEFNKDYVNTGIFDKRFSKIIANAFEIRNKSDYNDFYVVNKQQTIALVTSAKELYDKVEIYLAGQYPD
jgi:uncharacterized protein (UPF0332 family)